MSERKRDLCKEEGERNKLIIRVYGKTVNILIAKPENAAGSQSNPLRLPFLPAHSLLLPAAALSTACVRILRQNHFSATFSNKANGLRCACAAF